MTTSSATTATTRSTEHAFTESEAALITAVQNADAAQATPDPAPPVPVPVLAPYLGLVAAVLSTLGGGWLLLAPYALDFRHGAKHLPRAATVDLESGAAVIAVGIVAAVLFSMNLVLRLRGDDPDVLATAKAAEPQLEESPDEAAATERTELARPKEADPGGALRELLTPLVAALAADLRSHDQDRTQRKAP
jgi:hypothetical protein